MEGAGSSVWWWLVLPIFAVLYGFACAWVSWVILDKGRRPNLWQRTLNIWKHRG